MVFRGNRGLGGLIILLKTISIHGRLGLEASGDTENYHHVNFFIDFQEKMSILDIQKIQAQIRRIVKTGNVAISRHCREVSMPERNVDYQDILKVLNWGQVVHDPDEDCDMKFKVTGLDLECEPLTAIVILLDENSLLVKTVW